MTIEESIVVLLSQANRGLTTDQLAKSINEKHLHVRKDGLLVSSKQVYAVICRHPEMFVKEGGQIYLMI